LNRYDSYKDSGVEWIGEIPSGWGVGKMGYILSNNDGGVWGSDDEDEIGTYVIRSTEITIDGKWDLSNPMKRILTEKEIEKCRLYKNDIVITKSSGSPDHIGKSVIVDGIVESMRCCYSNFVQRIRFNSTFNPYLYHMILNSNIVREQFRFLTQSTTGLGNLNGSTLNEIQLPFIPLHEQHQIVEYLDNKTSTIDSLIQSKEKKITLLKEKRISLINQVITKGLNPDVEMKDSGVEWIGEIPSGWEIIMGSFTGSYSKGRGIKKDEVREIGLPCIRYGEIYTKYEHSVLEPISFINNETSLNSVSISKGTLLLTGSGETTEEIGKCVVYLGNDNVWVGGDIIILKPSKDFDPIFLSYLINSESVRVQREMFGKGEIVVHIYSKNFKEMKFPLPPLHEQHQIVEYLDKETKLIDETISSEQKKIELLKEYKQSLISEVVTGKRKVVN
jgi:type I restriction enzyme S subunit